jgi:hypothetical protein
MESLENISQKSNKNDELFFTAPVMIPGEPDCDYERGEKPFTPDEIRRIAVAYKDYKIVDREHEFFQTGEKVGEPVRSWITDEPLKIKYFDGEETTVPAGTWMATTKITDPKTRQMALNGDFTGYSPTVLKRKSADKISMKRSQGDIIHSFIDEDPVGFTISLVNKPCLRKAKFCKCDKVKDMDDKTFKDQLRIFLGLENASDETNTADSGVGMKSEDEYVTKEEFDEFKDDFLAAMKAVSKRKQKKEKEEEDTTAASNDDGADSEDEEETTNSNGNEDEGTVSDEDIDKKIASLQAQIKKLQQMKSGNGSDVAKKGKGLNQHDVTHVAKKSDTQTVYEIMGRSSATHMKVE